MDKVGRPLCARKQHTQVDYSQLAYLIAVGEQLLPWKHTTVSHNHLAQDNT